MELSRRMQVNQIEPAALSCHATPTQPRWKNFMRLHLLSVTTLCVLMISPLAIAPGGGGFDQSSFSQNRVDKQYETGKSYYKSRQADGSRLEYCVKTDDKLKKLSRSSVRPFKKGPASAFIASLYSCANPELKIAEVVPDDQGDAILYYLNKRFKLRLSGS